MHGHDHQGAVVATVAKLAPRIGRSLLGSVIDHLVALAVEERLVALIDDESAVDMRGDHGHHPALGVRPHVGQHVLLAQTVHHAAVDRTEIGIGHRIARIDDPRRRKAEELHALLVGIDPVGGIHPRGRGDLTGTEGLVAEPGERLAQQVVLQADTGGIGHRTARHIGVVPIGARQIEKPVGCGLSRGHPGQGIRVPELAFVGQFVVLVHVERGSLVAHAGIEPLVLHRRIVEAVATCSRTQRQHSKKYLFHSSESLSVSCCNPRSGPDP